MTKEKTLADTGLVIATGNTGKLKEFEQLFSRYQIQVQSQSAFNVPEAIEDGLSFVENALIKARNAAQHSGLPAIADDSGLEVDALNGQPGIYSARYSADSHGELANDQTNNEKLLAALDGVDETERSARFVCALVYMRHALDPTPIVSLGLWPGRILRSPLGENGFGYDPLFYLPEHDCSSAELNADKKNTHSHRGQAMRQLFEQLSALDILNN